jgi:hypothetical protein
MAMCHRIIRGFSRLGIGAAVLVAIGTSSSAMDFTWRDRATVVASGPIGRGDAAKFASLPKFDTLELDSLGGLVDEALAMAANMDARGGIRTVVKPGVSCASACAAILFVSGATRVVYMGGRLGIHSCAYADGTKLPECNKAMAANATGHGVPWGNIETFANATKPTDMMWFGADDAECWGFMKWSAEDGSNSGLACFAATVLRTDHRPPNEVTVQKANDIACRMNAGTSLIYVPTGLKGQGFSDTYRKACERVAADPKTPKYAAVDILLWLTLTDPNILALKPGTLMLRIMGDEDNAQNCWKCFTIVGMSVALHGHPKDALKLLQRAATLVKRDTGAVPVWLTSRADVIATEAAKTP